MTNMIPDDLFPNAKNPDDIRVINDRCMIRIRDGHKLVIVSGMVLAQYGERDRVAEAYAMVNLIDQGLADQNDVARAFVCCVRTVRRHQQRFEDGGLSALGHGRGYPAGRARQTSSRRRLIGEYKAQGIPVREIARRLGVSEGAVRKVVRHMGWKTAAVPPQQPMLMESEPPDGRECGGGAETAAQSCATDTSGAYPKLSAFSSAAPSPASQDDDSRDRCLDRMFARLGLQDDAAPLFGSRSEVPRAGVLLAVPALVGSGIFACAQEVYGSIGPAFFGLRTTIMTLLLMALWRIRRPEGLKEHSPADLGCVLGVDRAPEVKTLRRKLSQLAAMGKATSLGHALAQRRVALRGVAVGFLYVDGHVRVYHGTRRLPKAHVARMRLSMPATSDYWVNDSAGDPVFVMTAEANAGMVKMLPPVLEEIRSLVGPRRVTVVFDRGGYSPALFQKIVAAGFDLLTYRKGRVPHIPVRRFRKHRIRVEDRLVTYVLADQEVRLLKGALRLRQVTRLTDTGHQTPILTSRRDLPPAWVAYRMFDRWRQENFFKYLREEYALDALADYAVVPDNPAREVPNPAWARIDAQYRQEIAHLDRLQSEYGVGAFANSERRRPTMRGFKIAHGYLGRQIRDAVRRVNRLKARRARVPRRVPVQSLTPDPVIKLAPETKHLTNLVKMVAYQAESELLRIVMSHYRRADDEGRTLIQSALSSPADLHVTSREIRVTLAPQSSPHRTRAIAALCEKLNETAICFPSSKLRLRFAVHAPN